jgi:hypothetical protein
MQPQQEEQHEPLAQRVLEPRQEALLQPQASPLQEQYEAQPRQDGHEPAQHAELHPRADAQSPVQPEACSQSPEPAEEQQYSLADEAKERSVAALQFPQPQAVQMQPQAQPAEARF